MHNIYKVWISFLFKNYTCFCIATSQHFHQNWTIFNVKRDTKSNTRSSYFFYIKVSTFWIFKEYKTCREIRINLKIQHHKIYSCFLVWNWISFCIYRSDLKKYIISQITHRLPHILQICIQSINPFISSDFYTAWGFLHRTYTKYFFTDIFITQSTMTYNSFTNRYTQY